MNIQFKDIETVNWTVTVEQLINQISKMDCITLEEQLMELDKNIGLDIDLSQCTGCWHNSTKAILLGTDDHNNTYHIDREYIYRSFDEQPLKAFARYEHNLG